MNPCPAMHPAQVRPDAAVPTTLREFLAFKLGADEYGIDNLRVHEIRSYERPTRVAGAPEFVKGVINLRGTIVPIVDLRLKLQARAAQADALSVVIVSQVGRRVMGLVVDGVSDVVTLQPDQLRSAALPGAEREREHLLAVGTFDERLLLLVDIEKLLHGTDAVGPVARLQ